MDTFTLATRHVYNGMPRGGLQTPTEHCCTTNAAVVLPAPNHCAIIGSASNQGYVLAIGINAWAELLQFRAVERREQQVALAALAARRGHVLHRLAHPADRLRLRRVDVPGEHRHKIGAVLHRLPDSAAQRFRATTRQFKYTFICLLFVYSCIYH